MSLSDSSIIVFIATHLTSMEKIVCDVTVLSRRSSPRRSFLYLLYCFFPFRVVELHTLNRNAAIVTPTSVNIDSGLYAGPHFSSHTCFGGHMNVNC